jgi:hypothetical protein
MSRMVSSRGNRTSNMIGRGKVPPVVPGSVVAQRSAKKPIHQEGRGGNSVRCAKSSGPCRPSRITNLGERATKERADKIHRWRAAKLPSARDLEFDDSPGLTRGEILAMQANLAMDRISGDNGLPDMNDCDGHNILSEMMD